MPTNLKNKSVLIVDNGLFVEIAPRLARDFGQVMYYMPWANAYPRSASTVVGEGLDGVERVLSFWDRVPDADVVVFPDLYFADWQWICAEKFDKPVWGHRDAELLELDRQGTRELQEKLGLPAPGTDFIEGVDALAEYLEKPENENKWVKLSAFRGDGETWHHECWETSETYLNHFRDRVGALSEDYSFMVEDHIEGIEIGYDGWTVRGEWPSGTYWGFEIKDHAYVGQFSPYSELPAAVHRVNEAFSPLLKREKATGFLSFEFRMGRDGEPYLIDPCLRNGSPPFEVTMEAYDNIAEIIWEGAHGRMTEPKPLGKYTAMALIHCPFALTGWVPITCPPDVRRWLKLRNAAVINDRLYHVPVGGEMPEIGAVVAVADDLEEAKELVAERAEQVKGYQLSIKVEALVDTEEEIEEAREYGVKW